MVALPEIDEHAIEVDAARERVWFALETGLPRMLGGRGTGTFARLLGCRDSSASIGTPIEVGATMPGFHVSETRPPSLLALEGEHRFSRYRLTFHIDELAPERSLLRAQTHALFPGIDGRIYRALVIGTRGHVVAVRRILGALKRKAEARQEAA